MPKRRRQFGNIDEIPSRVAGRPPRYRARYLGPDGRRHRSGTFELMGDAEGFLRVVLRDIRDGVWHPGSGWPAPDAPKPVAPLLSAWLEGRITARATRVVRPLRPSTVAR